jgi:sulfur carrier protein
VIVLINNLPVDLPPGPDGAARVSDAVRSVGAVPPFAVAVNLQFVPASQYASTLLGLNDKIEIIRPVTGG